MASFRLSAYNKNFVGSRIFMTATYSKPAKDIAFLSKD